MRHIAPIAAGAPSYSAAEMVQPRSPWQSPVPYLFGGVAAMLGLIAFALLILACSYWRLSTRRAAAERDLEGGAQDKDGGSGKVCEEKFLVIMAGNDKPTFLATAALCNTVASVGCGNGKCVGSDELKKAKEKAEKTKNQNLEMSENENTESSQDKNEAEDRLQ